MQTATTTPVMYEETRVSGEASKTTTPRAIQYLESISYETNSLPTGGTFKTGVYKVTAGSHNSAQVSPGTSGEMSVKIDYGQYYVICRFTGPLSPPLTVAIASADCDPGLYNSMRDQALTKAFAKLGKPSSELGAELGELQETLQMLRNPLKGLRDFLSKDNEYWSRALAQVIKNRKFPTRHLKLTGKTVSETWLEIRYGIMPFIRTIQELVKLSLDVGTVDQNAISTVGGGVKDVIVKSISGPTTSFNSRIIVPTTGTRVTSVKVNAKIYFRRKHALSRSRQLGLDIVNVPEVMWQLATCSFIVDWFIDLGAFIASWRYTPEIQVLGATVSYRFDAQTVSAYSWQSAKLANNTTWMSKPGRSSSIATCKHYTRTIVAAKPPGAPRFLTTSRLSIPKVIDLVLIAAQRIYPLLRRNQ